MDRIDKDSNDDIEKFRLNFANRLTVTSLFKFVVSSVYLVSNRQLWSLENLPL